MNPDDLIRRAIERVQEPRFFRTERGYQGALAAQMTAILANDAVWPGNPIVEEEYQKRACEHGLKLRPDIIVHIPFGRPGMTDRTKGNYLVLGLKLAADRTTAVVDFQKLVRICDALKYANAVFINVASHELFLPSYQLPQPRAYSFREFSVSLNCGRVAVQSFMA
ncbi:MAG: hypothetical protein ABSH34_31060 [Verrucomicrobiota bacterium]|jgi:hypothetical protein